MKKSNPHCPVLGCKTDKPHDTDPLVQGMLAEFGSPEKLTLWTRTAMAELSQSICRDLQEKKIFAWLSRLRQPEDIYVRTLYTLFIATKEELPHIVSGDTPNGMMGYYKPVNRLVFEGRGLLDATARIDRRQLQACRRTSRGRTRFLLRYYDVHWPCPSPGGAALS